MTIADMLDGLELVQDFKYPELEMIAGYVMHEDARQGKVIFREGDPGDFMLIVIDGKIAIYKQGEHGSQLLSNEIKGRLVGEMSVLDHEPRSATCVAETDCELLILTSTNLKKMAAEHPTLAYHFMANLARLLSRRLRRASALMADFLDQ